MGNNIFRFKRGYHKLPTPVRRTINVIGAVGSAYSRNEVEERSAALAFHIVLALVPLLFLLVMIGGLFVSDQVLIRSITQLTAGVLDETVGDFIEGLLLTIQELRGAVTASVVSIVVLLFAAARAIYHFRSAFHVILVGEERERESPTLRGILRYLGSMAILIVLLMLVVLLILFKSIAGIIVAQGGIVTAVGGPFIGLFGSSFALVALWLSLSVIYRLVGEAYTTLQSRLAGALIAAALITLLNELFALVLSDVAVAAYGVASSLVALMLWSYYAVMSVLVGAEFAKILARKGY